MEEKQKLSEKEKVLAGKILFRDAIKYLHKELIKQKSICLKYKENDYKFINCLYQITIQSESKTHRKLERIITYVDLIKRIIVVNEDLLESIIGKKEAKKVDRAIKYHISDDANNFFNILI